MKERKSWTDWCSRKTITAINSFTLPKKNTATNSFRGPPLCSWIKSNWLFIQFIYLHNLSHNDHDIQVIAAYFCIFKLLSQIKTRLFAFIMQRIISFILYCSNDTSVIFLLSQVLIKFGNASLLNPADLTLQQRLTNRRLSPLGQHSQLPSAHFTV